MNIDTMSNLISSCDVSTFRTISLIFLDLIGFSRVHFCDGPYDGGKDFKIYDDKNRNIKFAIQISIEKNWAAKTKRDSIKINKNYGIDKIFFISNRRIPEASFQKLSNEILAETGITVTRFDNQAISSEFIKHNKTEELLKILGVETTFSKKIRNFSPKHEAISSLLIFGEETKLFRDSIFDSLIKSYLSAHPDGIERDKLIDLILSDNSFSDNQAKYVNSHIDRLLQKGSLIKDHHLFKLKKNELNKFNGLRKSGEQDYLHAQKDILNLLRERDIEFDDDELELFFNNIIDFHCCPKQIRNAKSAIVKTNS